MLTGDSPRWKVEDLSPLAVLIQQPSFLFVAKDSPYKTWADFEKAAKAEPGKLKVATVGFGSVDDFTLKHLEAKGGVKVVQVPFSKPSERYVSILGGHADALYEQAGDVAQFIKSEVRLDRALVDYLKEAKVPCVDLLQAHAADAAQFKGTPEEALSRYFVGRSGHYNPLGNHFCAFALKDALLRLLDPKPPAYRR